MDYSWYHTKGSYRLYPPEVHHCYSVLNFNNITVHVIIINDCVLVTL